MMKQIRLALALAAPVLALSACATPYASPVEVTRFTAPDRAELGRGAITVRPAPGMQGGTLEFAAWEQAVAAELARLGYSVGQSAAPQVAEVRVEREERRADGRRGPVSVGVGGSTGSYGSGLGLGLGFDLSGRNRPLVDTQLGVVIRDSATGQSLWEGRAAFSATTDSELARREAAATRLASALFSGFPGRSGETIEVK